MSNTDDKTSPGDYLFAWPQYLLPHHAISRLTLWVTRSRVRWFKNALMKWFIRHFNVDMHEAAQPDYTQYEYFNAFFTRALKPGARTFASDTSILACPVDGAVSQAGPIHDSVIYQAKGHDYTSLALLGGYEDIAATFRQGSFVTLYLSPRDYHRIHMPCAGRLRRMIYVPGDLFSVNPLTARSVPGLFARNERVVCVFESEHGPFVLVLVGATIVGSMATVWHGVVNPPRTRDVREWHYRDDEVTLNQGDEVGRFLLGSTVVMLFPRDALVFSGGWAAGRGVRLGEAMGHLVPTQFHSGF